jgi:hypothetical protein
LACISQYEARTDGLVLRIALRAVTRSAHAVDFSEELTVLQSETDASGRYLICSEFVALSSVAGSADEGMDPADDGE